MNSITLCLTVFNKIIYVKYTWDFKGSQKEVNGSQLTHRHQDFGF